MEEELEKAKEINDKFGFILDLMAETGDPKAKLMQISHRTIDKIHNLLDTLLKGKNEEKIEFATNNFNQINNMLDDITKALEDGTYKAKTEEN